MNIEQVADGVLNVDYDYQQVFEDLKGIMVQHGGKIKQGNTQQGTMEASFRYGINPFGLRVLAKFNTLESGRIQVVIRGSFKDAFDTTGVARNKANEIIGALMNKYQNGGGAVPVATILPPPAPANGVPYQGKSKTTAGLMGIFAGGAGFHKFYLGSWGWGLTYIVVNLYLLFSGNIPFLTVVGGIEGLIYLFMSQDSFDQKYNYRVKAPFRW